MTKTIILDTDIISTFAKIDRLTLLKNIFSQGLLKITQEIYDELSVPLDFGYDFPEKIYDEIDVISLTDEEQKRYQELLLEDNPPR